MTTPAQPRDPPRRRPRRPRRHDNAAALLGLLTAYAAAKQSDPHWHWADAAIIAALALGLGFARRR